MYRWASLGLAAGLALLGFGMAGAQGRPGDGDLPLVGLQAVSPSRDPNRLGQDILRRAMPVDDYADWIAEDDPSVRLLVSDPAAKAALRLTLAVGPDGAVTGCRIDRSFGDGRLFEGLCDRVAARARLRPAIDPAGVTVSDQFSLDIVYGRGLRPEPAGSPRRLVDRLLSPPAIVVVAWGGGFTGPVTIRGLDLVRGSPSAPDIRDQTGVGVEVWDGSPTPRCRVMQGSGDPDLNARACTLALQATYDFSAVKKGQRYIPLLLVRQRGKPRFLLPVHSSDSGPVVQPDSRANLAAALPSVPVTTLARMQATVAVDPQGRVTGCLIENSSDDDATDVLVCRQIRAVVRFEPAQDVFGRAHQSLYVRWLPVPLKSN